MASGTVSTITTLPAGNWDAVGCILIGAIQYAIFLDKTSNKVISVTLA